MLKFLQRFLRGIEWFANVSSIFNWFNITPVALMTMGTIFLVHHIHWFKKLDSTLKDLVLVCFFSVLIWLIAASVAMFLKIKRNETKIPKKEVTNPRPVNWSETPPPWELEDAENSKLKPPKDSGSRISGIISRKEWKEMQEGNFFASEVLASQRINMELDRREETDRKNFEDYLQRQIDWFEKFIQKVGDKVNTAMFSKQEYWERQTIGGIGSVLGPEFADKIREDFHRHFVLAQQHQNTGTELRLKLSQIKGIRSNVEKVEKFDVRDLEKWEMDADP